MRNVGGRRLPSILLMTDDTRAADWAEAVRALPRGSAVIVRHREPKAREALARQLRAVTRAVGVLLLIADDPALAVRVRADGAHVPEARAAMLPGLRARHPRWLLTCSAHNVAAVRRGAVADAVVVSPVFQTASHKGRSELGMARFASLARHALGVYALGGVDEKTIRRLVAHRIVGIGLIGGWLRS